VEDRRWEMEATALNPLGEKREDRRGEKIEKSKKCLVLAGDHASHSVTSDVSPCEWQPGKAGQLMLNPPSSISGFMTTLKNMGIPLFFQKKSIFEFYPGIK
jgi:hypothetical protein